MSAPIRTLTLYDFLTDREVKRAIKLGNRVKVRDELIIPNMERINKALGQENDPDYLSYAVEYVMTTSGTWKR